MCSAAQWKQNKNQDSSLIFFLSLIGKEVHQRALLPGSVFKILQMCSSFSYLCCHAPPGPGHGLPLPGRLQQPPAQFPDLYSECYHPLTVLTMLFLKCASNHIILLLASLEFFSGFQLHLEYKPDFLLPWHGKPHITGPSPPPPAGDQMHWPLVPLLG